MKRPASHKAIREIIARLGRLEKAAFGPESKIDKKQRKQADREGLPSHILSLRDRGFFKQPKTAKEVHAKLQSDYPCDLNRVEVALLRLQKRRQLRKTSKGVGDKKQVAYVW